MASSLRNFLYTTRRFIPHDLLPTPLQIICVPATTPEIIKRAIIQSGNDLHFDQNETWTFVRHIKPFVTLGAVSNEVTTIVINGKNYWQELETQLFIKKAQYDNVAIHTTV